MLHINKDLVRQQLLPCKGEHTAHHAADEVCSICYRDTDW